MNPKELMGLSPIIPVISIKDADDALPLAKALSAGGIDIMEITLRTDAALDAIAIIAKEFPKMNVGAGTVCNENDILNAKKAGAKFVFSPGISQQLLDASQEHNITLIPGVSTASEVMMAQNNGILYCKLFPALLSGGVNILKAFQGPFAQMHFCPTGGVNLENINQFLTLKNVACVGGTWIATQTMIENKEFEKITTLCQEALKNSIKG